MSSLNIKPSISLVRLSWAVGGILVALLLELAVGLKAGSLALVSDASHLFVDFAALLLTTLAAWRSQHPANARYTYGHQRFGILAATFNSLLLIVIGIGLLSAAIARLQHPTSVNPTPIIGVATFTLIVNLSIALGLYSHQQDLNIRSAFLHVLSDTFSSVGVIVAGIIIALTGYNKADPIISLGIAVLVVLSALNLLQETYPVLNQSTPKDINADQVHQTILEVPIIQGVHDLHIWNLDHQHRALSAHLTVQDLPLATVNQSLQNLTIILRTQYRIEHTTLQPETTSFCSSEFTYCTLES